MALVLGLLMSAGLYFAYLWPQVEPDEDEVPPPAATTEAVKPAESAKSEVKTDDKADESSDEAEA